ncbi:MAG: hypothetical protein AABX63_00900 [Nanoarchaeota archaeon]
MERFQELRDSAGKKIQIADYMLTMTYPLVRDPKLLLSVVENLFLAYSYSISSLLHYERLFKRIPPFPDDFSSKIDLFADRCMGKYGIDSENLRIVKDLKEIIVAHKKSPVEFPRKDSFVICDEGYRLRTISPSIIKGYVEKAKLFIRKMSSIVSEDDAIFR